MGENDIIISGLGDWMLKSPVPLTSSVILDVSDSDLPSPPQGQKQGEGCPSQLLFSESRDENRSEGNDLDL